ncbi:hypothetical protein ACRAWF_33295 [Streptomyces sp. L7]
MDAAPTCRRTPWIAACRSATVSAATKAATSSSRRAEAIDERSRTFAQGRVRALALVVPAAAHLRDRSGALALGHQGLLRRCPCRPAPGAVDPRRPPGLRFGVEISRRRARPQQPGRRRAPPWPKTSVRRRRDRSRHAAPTSSPRVGGDLRRPRAEMAGQHGEVAPARRSRSTVAGSRRR